MKHILLVPIAILALACPKKTEQTTTTAAAPPPTTSQASATSAPASVPAPSTPAPATPSTAPAGGIATEETNWKGVSATVTEFRRKGNTLTAKVNLTCCHGSEEGKPDLKFDEVYLIDTGAGKKFNVLKDEKGNYIASLRSGWNDRWYETLKPGESYVLWMKFPAPPAETKSITLQIPSMPPFEDLNIQN